MDEAKRTSPYILIGVAVVALIVAAVVVVRRTGMPSSATAPVLTEEQKACLGLIEITDARMSAAENFLGDTVTYLDARLANKGTRVVRQLELELVFVDTLSQVVLREKARPVTARTLPLKPGETRAFRVSFEHMPVDWNQAPPTITPKSVQF